MRGIARGQRSLRQPGSATGCPPHSSHPPSPLHPDFIGAGKGRELARHVRRQKEGGQEERKRRQGKEKEEERRQQEQQQEEKEEEEGRQQEQQQEEEEKEKEGAPTPTSWLAETPAPPAQTNSEPRSK